MEEITGTIDVVFARFGDDDEFVVGNLRDKTTIKGEVNGNLQCGLEYRFGGKWITHHKYGRQFHFDSYTPVTPTSEAGTIAYLQQAAGIGRVTALRIWIAYGKDSLDTIKTRPKEVGANIKGLTVAKATDAAKLFIRIERMESTTIELSGLLLGRGFPKKAVKWAINLYSVNAAEKIKAEPYVTMECHGVGFKLADALYLSLGFPPEAIERQARCIVYAMQSDTNGNTWHSGDLLSKALSVNVGSASGLDRAVFKATEDGWIESRKEDGRWFYALAKDANAERSVSCVVERLNQASTETPASYMLAVTHTEGPTRHQFDAIRKTVEHPARVGILSGGPGTGKTYCLTHVLKQISGSVAICAPTGKAAVRVNESLAREGVGLKAMTIHRLLGVESCENGQWRFKHGPGCKLPYNWIVGDEWSMVSTPLGANLLSALGSHARLLLVGDPYQLAPIGHGAPLRDMIAGGVRCGELTETHRNAGRIAIVCSEIRRGIEFTPSESLDIENGENLLFHAVEESYQSDLRLWLEKCQDFGLDPVWDTMVLAALNQKSEIARKPLNKILQEHLNPAGKQVKGSPFRIGDKVICLQNGMAIAESKRDSQANEKGQIYVANGEIGKVLDVTPRMTIIEAKNPDRVIRVPRGKGDDSACNWDLGYAITVHKSQGSEAPAVFTMIDPSPAAKQVCTREWVYTAFSRASRYCIGIGSLETARGFCRTSGLWRRKTFLKEMIES